MQTVPEIKAIETNFDTQIATLKVASSFPDEALQAKLEEFAKTNDHIKNFKFTN